MHFCGQKRFTNQEKKPLRQVRPYSLLAPHYDELMSHINYEGWSAYIIENILNYKNTKSRILEVAAGTGIMSGYVRKVFHKLYITEFSSEMLRINTQKGNAVACDMTLLPFRNDFDAVYCTFDSVNYLLSRAKLIKLFLEINRVLNPGGVFCFDASLERNSLKYEKAMIFNEDLPEAIVSHKSIYNRKSRIHYNYFYFSNERGEILFEKHKQKIYPFEVYPELIRETGFELLKCYKAFTFRKGKYSDDRVFFIIRKPL